MVGQHGSAPYYIGGHALCVNAFWFCGGLAGKSPMSHNGREAEGQKGRKAESR